MRCAHCLEQKEFSGQSPSNSFSMFLRVPGGISLEPWRGTGSCFTVIGLYQMSCRAPCLTIEHPARFRRLNNSLHFII